MVLKLLHLHIVYHDSSQEGGKLGWIKFNSLNDNIKKEISKINKKMLPNQ